MNGDGEKHIMRESRTQEPASTSISPTASDRFALLSSQFPPKVDAVISPWTSRTGHVGGSLKVVRGGGNAAAAADEIRPVSPDKVVPQGLDPASAVKY